MPTNYIDGIPVEFPHSAYPCQITFMQSVLRALKNRQNALLESPTGTGKTLSLLCAALAWRTAEMGRIQLKEQMDIGRGADYDTIMERPSVGESNGGFRAVNSASGSVNRLQVALDESLNHSKTENSDALEEGGFNSKPPLIIYASRTHSQLAQVIGELRRTTYRPKISIVASRDQMCIHPNVKELTNSSTQSAACNRLTKKKACEFHARVPEALKHMKKSSKNENFSDNGNSNHQTNDSIDNTNENNDKQNKEIEIMDMEDIIKFASLHKACPYYTSRELLEDADLVFMPYNYLLDKKTRGSSLLSFKDAIVIFDEAHNVESSCYDAVSCEINSDDLTLSEKELQHCLGLLDSPFFGTSLSALGGVCKDSILVAIKFIQNLKINLDKFEIPKNVSFVSETGDAVFRVFEEDPSEYSQKPLEIDFLLGSFEEIVKLYLEDQYNRRSGKRSSFQAVVNALRTIYGQSAVTEEESDIEDPAVVYSNGLDRDKRRNELMIKSKAFYRMVITEPTTHTHGSLVTKLGNSSGSIKTRTLGYWCFNPGVVMKDLMGMGVRSIVLTSGTLSPMKSFMQEMQIDFHHVLENDHVIDDEQVFATVVGTGPTGKSLNSSFNQRDSQDYQQELGLTIVNFCRVIPDGVLVFFPSYQVMDSCLSYWQICRPGGSGAAGSIPDAQTIFQMIQSHKIPVIEPKNKGELSVAMERYSRIIDDHSEPRGSIFFAVCRGKVSEGLDFADAKGRAVIVTGIPYPPFKDPKIILKKQYLQDQQQHSPVNSNSNSYLTGHEWYNQQASRAVNQALGRVIRHRKDFGAILLCDERFGNPGTVGQLSKWLRGRLKVSVSFGEVQGGLARFFKDKPKNNRETISDKPQQTIISDSYSNSNPKLNNNSSTNMKNEVQMQKFKLDSLAFSMGSSKSTNATNEMIFKSANSAPIVVETKKFDWFNTSKTVETENKVTIKIDENKNKLSSQINNSNVDKEKQKKAQDYLELTRKSLTKEDFRNFMGLLKNYRAGQISIEKLLTDLVEVVNGESTSLAEEQIQALLEGFETFVPVKHRNLFEEVLSKQKDKFFRSKSQETRINKVETELELSGEDQQYFIGKQKLHTDFVGKRPTLEIEPIILKRKLTDSLPILKKGELRVSSLNASDSHENCPICKDVYSDPFRAKCNHVACFECWNAWLSRTLECPLCRQRTRVSQLRRTIIDGYGLNAEQ